MLNIGCHLSIAKGFAYMGKEAVSIGANTVQFFSRNPRGGAIRDIDPEDVEAFRKIMKEHKFAQILAHAPYTMNACASDEKIRQFASEVIKEDLERMEFFPNQLYNFHPGSHVKQGIKKGIDLIAQLLNGVLKQEQTTTVLLETMAGKGTEVGSRFEELKEILDQVELKEKMGVCLDVCHVYDAGYDIVQNLDGVLKEFDQIIGLEKLKAIHLNDSKNPFKSHKDRHETIGNGFIGLDAMIRIINHSDLKHLPFFLETPNEPSGHKKEIELLRKYYQN